VIVQESGKPRSGDFFGHKGLNFSRVLGAFLRRLSKQLGEIHCRNSNYLQFHERDSSFQGGVQTKSGDLKGCEEL
jgi:hypothetical protein